MNRARWIISTLTLFVLWLIGALILMPRMQRDLENAAQTALSEQSTLKSRLGKVHATFDGQLAHLLGSVRTIQDRLVVEATVRDFARAPTPLSASLGLRLNPVSNVSNELEVDPYPAGWMLLAAKGVNAQLLGTAANEYEARDLSRSVQESWGAQGGAVEGTLGTDAENHDEAANVSATLHAVPAPKIIAQAYLTRIGQSWKQISLQHPENVLQAEARALGVSDAEWERQVLPILRDLRSTLQQQSASQIQSDSLLKLPPSHLFVAVRGKQIIMRGEVGSAAMKRAILDESLKVFAPRRLIDEIRVSSARRPSGDFGSITTALLPSEDDSEAKSFFLGLSGDAWKALDWKISNEALSLKNNLPAGINPDLLQSDSAALIDWLRGSELPANQNQLQPAVITLAIFGSKAILSGQIAEESLRAQIVDAARKTYAPHILVSHDELRVMGNSQPYADALHILKSLPPPPDSSSAGIFAIAAPGGTWRVIPVTKQLVEAGGLAKSNEIPIGIPVSLIEQLSAEAIEQLHLHLSNLPSSISDLGSPR